MKKKFLPSIVPPKHTLELSLSLPQMFYSWPEICENIIETICSEK